MAFSLDEAARLEINRRKKDSNCSEPVATLGELADADPAMQSRISQAIKSGATENELLTIAQSELAGQSGEFRLEVFVYEKEDCSSRDLVLVNDLLMAIPSNVREALSSYRLTFKSERFLLEGPTKTLTNLRSLAE